MLNEDTFRWVEPTPFRATHKGGSVLDFVFLSGPAKKWTAAAEVFKLPDDEIDTLQGSDHRPLLADFDTPGKGNGPVQPMPLAKKTPPAVEEAASRQEKRNEILRRINAIDRELTILRRLVRELADD